jgi:hypothetical protein
MAYQARTEFHHALRACSELDVDDIYDCLQAQVGDPGSTRSLREALLRSMGIQVVALASYGHLLSMQGLTKVQSLQLYVSPLVFFFFPALPATQFIVRTFRTCFKIVQRGRTPYRYFISACVGCHVTMGGVPVPLHEIDPSDLQFDRKEFTVTWTGQTILLLLFLVQFLGSLIILSRALFHYIERGNMYLTLDQRNFEVVLGGIVVIANSICIGLLNGDWRYVPASFSMQLSNIEEVRLDLDVFSSIVPSTVRPTVGTSSLIHEHRSSSILPNTFLRVIRCVSDRNVSFSKWLSTRIPMPLQIATDYALIAHCSLDLLRYLNRYTKGSSGLFELYCTKRSSRYPDCFCTPLTQDVPTEFWRNMVRPRQYLSPTNALICIVVARIVLADICRAILWLTPQAPVAVHRMQKWIVGGRSITSFPIYLAGLIFSVTTWMANSIAQVYMMSYAEANYVRGDNWNRFNHQIASFKDPWYDNMYIL